MLTDFAPYDSVVHFKVLYIRWFLHLKVQSCQLKQHQIHALDVGDFWFDYSYAAVLFVCWNLSTRITCFCLDQEIIGASNAWTLSNRALKKWSYFSLKINYLSAFEATLLILLDSVYFVKKKDTSVLTIYDSLPIS